MPFRQCFALIALVLLPSLAAAKEKLRIVTFNAEFLAAPGTPVKLERFRFDPARKRHCKQVASLIETLEPDVFNLVEVINGETVQYIVKLLHERGLTDYQGYHLESADLFTGQDIAVISRLPLDEIDGQKVRTFFSGGGDDTWRERYMFQDKGGSAREGSTSVSKNLVYGLTHGGKKIGFLGLHMKANPDDPASNAQRTAEAKVAARILQKEVIERGYTPIVLGDINDYDPDVPDRDDTRSTKTTVLADLKNYDTKSPGPELINAANRIKDQSERYTSIWDRNENGVYDSDDVATMLDHVLLHKDLMPSVRRVVIPHITDLSFSDHFPIVVDLEWE